jgi:hypothetical protein
MLWQVEKSSDGIRVPNPVCRGLHRQQAITNVSLLRQDAKPPKDGFLLCRTVGGASACIRGVCMDVCVWSVTRC